MNKNKKILNATPNVDKGIEFKSKFEAEVFRVLTEEGFDPKYEAWKFTIWEGFVPKVPFYNKNKKTRYLKLDKDKIRDITYTPDFTFDYNGLFVIIEVKGFENDVFPLKKKLFRKYLEEWQRPVVYFEIYSKKQLFQVVEIVKNYEQNNSNSK